jgi:hypothetical protein
MVGLERLSKVPSWGRVTGPPSASARKTARELSINESVSSKEPPSCSESGILVQLSCTHILRPSKSKVM